VEYVHGDLNGEHWQAVVNTVNEALDYAGIFWSSRATISISRNSQLHGIS
jgi:hypothetical protein